MWKEGDKVLVKREIRVFEEGEGGDIVGYAFSEESYDAGIIEEFEGKLRVRGLIDYSFDLEGEPLQQVGFVAYSLEKVTLDKEEMWRFLNVVDLLTDELSGILDLSLKEQQKKYKVEKLEEILKYLKEGENEL